MKLEQQKWKRISTRYMRTLALAQQLEQQMIAMLSVHLTPNQQIDLRAEWANDRATPMVAGVSSAMKDEVEAAQKGGRP